MLNQLNHDDRLPRAGELAHVEQAKFEALRDAVNRGLEDLAAGRFRDVSADELERYLAELGARASRTARAGQ
jgi:hypothetical protein